VLDWAKKTELSNKSALECVQVSLKLFSDLNFQIRNYFSDLVGIMQSLQAYNNTDYKLEYRELAWSKMSENQDKQQKKRRFHLPDSSLVNTQHKLSN